MANGDTATVTISGTAYEYTASATDNVNTVADNLIAKINSDSAAPVQAQKSFAEVPIIRLSAKTPGTAGNGITLAVSNTGSVILTATKTALCCAATAGALVDANYPAMAGETVTIYTTGLGITHPLPPATGFLYQGAQINWPNDFVNAFAGGAAGTSSTGSGSQFVLSSGLIEGMIGVYQVDLDLTTSFPTNPATQLWIGSNNTASGQSPVSNIVTLNVVANPNP